MIQIEVINVKKYRTNLVFFRRQNLSYRVGSRSRDLIQFGPHEKKPRWHFIDVMTKFGGNEAVVE